VLQEDGLPQDHPVVEGLLDVQDNLGFLLLLDQRGQRQHYVLAPEIEVDVLLLQLLQLLLGRGRTLQKIGLAVHGTLYLLAHVLAEHRVQHCLGETNVGSRQR
jgi:hypothetical protein